MIPSGGILHLEWFRDMCSFGDGIEGFCVFWSIRISCYQSDEALAVPSSFVHHKGQQISNYVLSGQPCLPKSVHAVATVTISRGIRSPTMQSCCGVPETYAPWGSGHRARSWQTVGSAVYGDGVSTRITVSIACLMLVGQRLGYASRLRYLDRHWEEVWRIPGPSISIQEPTRSTRICSLTVHAQNTDGSVRR